MDALVESLLKANLDDEQEPSRSAHASDASDEESNVSSTRNNTVETPPQHGGPQTGPKGVLADHRYHKQQVQQQKAAAIFAHNERMMSKAFITTTYQEDQEEKAQENLLKELENISSDDEEMLKKYRNQRLKEIKGVTNINKSLKKRFGSLKEISANQYVKAIDNEASNVCVIVHLYENSIPQCRLLNECLIHLARKFVGAKFLRILAHDLEFDPIGLPALLVYKNGELIANLVKITEEIGETNFDADTVEEVLIRYGAINVNEDIDDLLFKDYSMSRIFGTGKHDDDDYDD
ncbi:1275_t:CDS:2 [Funneliformis caledonium]|uniref:1275_t:CDS:1 n=2 Tax=Funneliformis TaxID=1117308 RepID=A0A9N9C2M6_9GLOM|nr:1275_t:CDS:2 [Funneliformis caledonium]CAG8605823.1 6038_t:CDS:2 [Funneliformis mosseae]